MFEYVCFVYFFRIGMFNCIIGTGCCSVDSDERWISMAFELRSIVNQLIYGEILIKIFIST